MSCSSPAPETQPVSAGAGENWARTFRYRAAAFAEPKSLDELQKAIQAGTQLKALGSRHSFSRVADTSGSLISMRHFDEVGEVNKSMQTVTVGGGVKYGDMVVKLDGQGYALHNLASLPHISIAGAIATGTHGSGSANGNLATAVEAFELVTSAGAVHKVSRAAFPEHFDGMVVSLGALGFLTKVTLRVEPTYQMRQYVFEGLSRVAMERNFNAIMDAAYSVSLFTTWGEKGIEEVWIKERTDSKSRSVAGKDFYGATPSTTDVHPIKGLPPEPCTPQMGVPGPWYERLPHFRMGFTPSSGEEIQSEFFVPRKDAVKALAAIFALHSQIAPVLQISEIRAIKGDSLWLSPAYGRDSIAIHFTWKKDEAGVLAVLPLVEAALMPFGPRPHWGKVFTLSAAEVSSQYEKMPRFRALLNQFDGPGKMTSSFLTTYILGT